MLNAIAARLGFPRTVVALSLVSLLNDAASEMITPLLPLFLTMTLGVGPVVVGLVEGVAETTSGLLKLCAGWLADRGWSAKRLVLAGYTVSNVARPLIGLAISWPFVLAMRFLDRSGKGLRTAPRDALIATAVPVRSRGRAFGFHRGMDHAGAVVGPLFAFALLGLGVELGALFLASVIPGVAVLALVAFGVQDERVAAHGDGVPKLEWRALDARLRGLVLAAIVLAFATMPEALLVLWASAHGIDLIWIPVLWSSAHVFKSLTAMAVGAWSDRYSRARVMLVGWSARVAVLALIASSAPAPWLAATLFIAYATALASTEGVERAFIGDRAPAALKGTAFGLYHLGASLAALPGALALGLVWQQISASAAFWLAAILTAGSAATFAWLSRAR
jgi:MFS family permease